MHDQAKASPVVDPEPDDRPGSAGWRGHLRDVALRNALRKRTSGVPTYSVPEAAALLSVSQEHLYRLIHAGGFPVVQMGLPGSQGRYVVPAKAVEQMLDDATTNGGRVEVTDWTASWSLTTATPRAGEAR